MENLQINYSPWMFGSGQIQLDPNGITFKNKLLGSKKSIPYSEIRYFVYRSTSILHRSYVLIGRRSSLFKSLGARIYMNLDEAKKLLDFLISKGAPIGKDLVKVMTGDNFAPLDPAALKTNNSYSLWMYPDYIFCIGKNGSDDFDKNTERIPNDKIRFVSTVGTNEVYFGGPEGQFSFKTFKRKERVEQLKAFAAANGARVGQEMIDCHSDTFWLGKLLKPTKFFHSEQLGVSSDGLNYTWRRGRKQDNIFLPYEEIKFTQLRKGLFHSNYIHIYGEQNVVSNLQFPNSAIGKLRDQLKKSQAQNVKMSLRPRTMFGLIPSPIARRRILMTDNGVVFKGKSPKEIVYAKPDEVTNMCWKKRHFFYLVGHLFYEVQGNNIRKDQGTSHQSVYMPRIFFWKKNAIKRALSKGEEFSYNKRSYKKLCVIEK